ncbi:hypothetical protein, partial [Actinotalea sp.]|uniref:hypothetical protein n=1 Tax=Actinotalea sp. TaxID=1872145 RepID=UPI00356375DE
RRRSDRRTRRGAGVVNPDCKGEKHGSCSGTGWSEIADGPIACPCPCHTATSSEPEQVTP